MSNAHRPTIICSCGHVCSTLGKRTTAYAVWSNSKLIEGRYRRTCTKCENDEKRKQMADSGYNPLGRFLPLA